MITNIISGGQTGADLAALETALQLNIPHGGWCPQGRQNEDGLIPPHFTLRETPDADPIQRTEWNVRDSDATLLLTLAPTPQGGSLRTREFAHTQHKPFLHLTPASPSPTQALQQFITKHQIQTLNIAGSRESEEPGIHTFTTRVLSSALA